MRLNRHSSPDRFQKFHSLLLLIVLSIPLLISACSTNVEENGESGTPVIPPALLPHEQLADYGLFRGDLKDLNPIEGLLPYNLNTELFTDYAEKQRFVYVPSEVTIELTGNNLMEFPQGSILVKNFYYSDDQQNPASDRTLIETRLLIHYDDGWRPNTYVWNSEQTGAVLTQSGGVKPVSWADSEGSTRNVNYKIPTVNECGACHRMSGGVEPLGPNVRNLNKLYPYPDEPVNQLEQWRASGFLGEDVNLDNAVKLPVWDDADTWTVNQRARAYLDVNCSNCHNEMGTARNTGLYLTYEEQDDNRIGICKEPNTAGAWGAGLIYDIVPGNADESILAHRMNSADPVVQMPRLGRTLIHDEAVQLITEWIESMEMNPCGEQLLVGE